jgi:hypothetical protein
MAQFVIKHGDKITYHIDDDQVSEEVFNREISKPEKISNVGQWSVPVKAQVEALPESKPEATLAQAVAFLGLCIMQSAIIIAMKPVNINEMMETATKTTNERFFQ